MPAVGSPFDADQEQAFEGKGTILLTGMEARDMAFHCFTSGGREKELSLQIRPSMSSFAEEEIWEIKDSTKSRLASLRVSVPQKSLSRMDGDQSLFCDLAKMFCAEGPKLLSGVQEALSRKDSDALRRASHALKGSISTFAARQATDAAARLEELAASGELVGAEDTYEMLATQVEPLKQALENVVKESQQFPETADFRGKSQ